MLSPFAADDDNCGSYFTYLTASQNLFCQSNNNKWRWWMWMLVTFQRTRIKVAEVTWREPAFIE